MSHEWGLIARGFAIAALGASASMLYIVGLSAIFVGRFSLAATALAIAVVGAVGFRRLVGSYLDVLDQRLGDDLGAMNNRVAADASVGSVAAEHTE
ncbi:MAG: hypothetical protein H0T51_17635 [Pirellulales bacterium]|nr:hypothetical protein [Pirellulales bacterium]